MPNNICIAIGGLVGGEIMIELKDDEKTLEIESDDPIIFGNALIQTLNNALDELNDGASLSHFVFEKIDNTTDYSYIMETQDGRIWTQTIGIPDPDQEANMNFNVPDRWKEESEFARHRGVRGTCIHIAKTLGVTKVECTWA